MMSENERISECEVACSMQNVKAKVAIKHMIDDGANTANKNARDTRAVRVPLHLHTHLNRIAEFLELSQLLLKLQSGK